MTTIEWTGKSWNPLAGCSVTSPGCKNCYAMKTAHRLGKIAATAPKYAGLTKVVNGKPVWTGLIGEGSQAEWEQPLRRRKPTVWFVNSMGDLFHPNVTDEQIDRVFAIMALCPQHQFQILTKYPARMRDWMGTGRSTAVAGVAFSITAAAVVEERFPEIGKGVMLTGDIVHLQAWPLPNVWLGVSVEDQRRADERIPILLDTPAAIRFVSCEPLLGAVKLDAIQCPKSNDGKRVPERALIGALSHCRSYNTSRGRRNLPHAGLDWVIVGGESGPAERPMHPDWARSLRDQCAAADVPFFFKQWGTAIPWAEVDRAEGREPRDRGALYLRGNKSLDPKTLDGAAHLAMPDTAS